MKYLVVNSKVILKGDIQDRPDRFELGNFQVLKSSSDSLQMIESDVDAFVGWTYLNGEFTPPPTAKLSVPQVVSRRQAKQALALAGLLDSVEGALAAIPDATTRKLATIEWQDSLEFQRNRPLVIQLATSLGLTSDDLDNLFITAATL